MYSEICTSVRGTDFFQVFSSTDEPQLGRAQVAADTVFIYFTLFMFSVIRFVGTNRFTGLSDMERLCDLGETEDEVDFMFYCSL